MGKTVTLSEFKSGSDTESFMKAMEYLKANPGSTLNIEPGIYNITTPLAKKTMTDVLSGVYGDNPEEAMFSPDFEYSSGLDFSGQIGTIVNAYGVTLLVDGFMEPITLKDCKNVKLNGLTIDHKRKPYSKAVVKDFIYTDKKASEGYLTAIFGDEYPTNPKIPMPRYCFFSQNANRFTNYNEFKFVSRKQLDGQLWRFDFKNLQIDTTGMELYIWHTFHSRPAILIENSNSISLTDVTIHSQPGMGIVAHRCENLLFERLRIIPSAGEHMSTNTDATHITSCKGNVRFENCFFDGQGDDSLNIHTYYHKIKKTGDNTCRIFLDAPTKTHSQTPDYPDIGDILDLNDIDSLEKADTYKVISCVCHPESWSSELIVDKQLPDNCEHYFFSNATRQPHLEFIGNTCHNHLARGALVKVKNALIEGNTFLDVVGTAIYVAAESWWREGVCTTENIVIRRNRISYCGRNNDIRQCDTAGICVTVDADNPCAATHKHVVIEDNIVDCPDSPHAIYVSNTKELILRRNTVVSLNEPIITI